MKTEGGTSISVSPHRSATTDDAVVVVAVAHDDVWQPRITMTSVVSLTAGLTPCRYQRAKLSALRQKMTMSHV